MWPGCPSSHREGHIYSIGKNRQQMSSEANGVLNSTAYMCHERPSMVHVNGQSVEYSREHFILHSLQGSRMNNNAPLTSTQDVSHTLSSCSFAVVQRANISLTAQTTISIQKCVQQNFPLLHALLRGGPTECNSDYIMDCNTGVSSSVSEETNLNCNVPAVTHCEGQQGSTSSQPLVLNYGQLRTNVLPQTSSQNINCMVTNTVAALPRQGSKSVSPETQHGPSPSLPEPSTNKNSALEKNELLTDSQMLDFIAQRLKYFKNLAQNLNNIEYGQSNSEEEQTLHASEEDPSHCLANLSISRTGTLKAIEDASPLKAVDPAVKAQGSSDAEKMERQGLSNPEAKQSFTTDKEGYEEDCTKEDNTILTQKVKESDSCANSTPGKRWESGTPITAEENSSHPREIQSADKKASLGCDSPVKNLSDVTVSLDSDGQGIYSNSFCEDETCKVSEDESYNSEYCQKTSKNVMPTVPTLHYTLVAMKELVASLENAEAPVVPRDNIRDFILQHYWNGNIKHVGVFSRAEYPQIIMDVNAICTKNEDESPPVLSAISGMTLDELVKKCPTLTINYTPSQEEYKSFWLNINERVDNIDKEPRVAWSLLFTREKGEEDICLKAANAADMMVSVPNKTDVVFPTKQQRLEKAAVAEESPTDSFSPLKMSVLSAEEARRIFYQQDESNPQTMLEHSAPLSENNCNGHTSLPGIKNEQLTEVGPSQDEDVTDELQTKLHLVVSENKIQEHSSLHEHQDVEPSKQTYVNNPKYDDDESPQHGDMKEDPKGQLSSPLTGNQTRKVASLSGNQHEGQSSQINANDANPVYLQPKLRTRLPENGCQQQAPLSGHKDEKPISLSTCRDPKYEDITDEDLSNYEDITSEDSPKYEDITDEDSQTDGTKDQLKESVTSLSENNSQKQAPPCRNQDNGQKQAITEMTSNIQALCRTEKDVLKQTCCCPYFVETEDGYENRLCPSCETERELGKETKDSTSYVSSSVFKGLNDNLVSFPVSGLFCRLSDDGISSNQGTEEVPKEPVSQTDATELDCKSVAKAKTSKCENMTKAEASLNERGSEHGDPQCEQFSDLEHEELMVDESPQNEETFVTGDKDFQYRDETEEEDEDVRMVITVAISDLIFEPTDGDHVSPKEFLPQDGENGEIHEDDVSCGIILPQCEVQDSTSKPATASPSSDIEVFESFDRFLKAKNIHFANCPIFSAPEDDDLETRDQGPGPQIFSVETESEPEYDRELHTPRKRQASTSETEHSSDYSISSPHSNFLTVSKQCWKNRPRPKRFRASAMSDSEDEEIDNMSNVSQRSPLPESDSESEDDERTNNAQKCQNRRLSTATKREDSFVESGCMITNRPSTESKTATNVIQCKSKRPKISNRKHVATAESDSETEQYSKKTHRRQRKLTCTASEGDLVTSQKRHATELVDNLCRDEGVQSPQQVRLSCEMQTEDRCDDPTVPRHRCMDSEREYTSASPPVVPCVLEQVSPGFTDSVKLSKESTVHKQTTKKKKTTCLHSQHEKELPKTLDGQTQTELTKLEHSNLLSQRRSLHKDGELRKPFCSKSLKGDKGKERNEEKQRDKREEWSEEMSEQRMERSLDSERRQNLKEENKKGKEGMKETEVRRKLQDKREKDEQRKASHKKDSSHQKPKPQLIKDTKGRFSSHKKGPATRKRQKPKTSECEAQATSSKQMSTSRECLSTSKEVLSNSRRGLSPSRECLSNSTEGLPAIECLSISKEGSSSRERLSKSREGSSSSRERVSKSKEGPSTSGEGTASSTKSVSKSRGGSPSSRERSSKSGEGPSTSRNGSKIKSREVLSSKDRLSQWRLSQSSKGSSLRECLSNSNEGSSSSRERLYESRESPFTYRESLPSSREHLSKTREGSPSSTKGSPSGECLSKSRESLSTSRSGSAFSREDLSKSRERSSSEKHLSKSSDGSSSSRKLLSESRKGPSSSREGLASSRQHLSKSREDLSSSTGFPSSECLSKPKESLSTPREHLSSSLEGPSTSRHAPSTSSASNLKSKSALSSITNARQQVLTQWQTSYYPTRRDRRTGCGTEEENLRTSSPTHSKYSPEKVHRDAEKEARLEPRHYDRGPRQRHTSQESAAPLMKKSLDQAKRTMATHREAPHERRHSVGEGYKWKDRRHSCETKGSSREKMECGSPPGLYY